MSNYHFLYIGENHIHEYNKYNAEYESETQVNTYEMNSIFERFIKS